MGESKQRCLRIDFDRRLKREFQGSKVTTDAGILAYRDLDDALESTEMAWDGFAEGRRTLVDNDITRETGEDRCQGCPTWPLKWLRLFGQRMDLVFTSETE
jgi:hypothetical protein